MSNTLDTLIAESPLPSDSPSSPLPASASPPASNSRVVGNDATLRSTSASIAVANTTYSGLSKRSTVYEAVASYRRSFRAQNIPREYSAYKHLGEITLVGGLGALVTGWAAGGVWHMLTTPSLLFMCLLAFATANGFEYYAHRYKLHNPLVHTRHSHTHHRFFTDKVMEFDEFRDAHAIFFPPRAPIFLIGLLLPILSIIPALIGGWQAGAAFACVLATYYVTYEYLHLAYHSPPDSILGSLPGVAYLRHHHQVHHSQQLMVSGTPASGKYNFNITFPICDWLVGTTYKAPPAAA